MKLLLFPILVLIPIPSVAETVGIPSEARLWLKIPPSGAPLADVWVSSGNAMQAKWGGDPAARERLTDISFPIRWWSWNEVSVRFTPVEDAAVELSLLGPWAADVDGAMPRLEVLWDGIRAEGAELVNGGFEEMADGRPVGWESPWAEYPAENSWPLANAMAFEGKRVAAARCERPLTQVLHVKGGQPVTLRLRAQAATPPGFVAPKASGDDTPAHRALAALKGGVNLGNGWESPPSAQWRQRFTFEDIDRIAAEGFDHIRVPVAWHFHLKPGADGPGIDPALLAELEPVLRRALEKDLRVLLNWHHFDDFTKDPAGNLDRFVSGWETIAAHFQSWPPGLFFELLNEPHGALTTGIANPIYEKTIAAIRATNPERIIVVSPGGWGVVEELDHLRLPETDDRIVVTIHNYAPFEFTHQGAGWVGYQDLRGIVYPGPPATPFHLPDSLRGNEGLVSFVERYNTLSGEDNPSSKRVIREQLDTARAWSLRFGRPVHLGEFGAHDVGDIASRRRYLHDVRTLAEERGIPWALWEWKAGFGYWDPAKNEPRFRRSLFE
jgi:endoglucanase